MEFFVDLILPDSLYLQLLESFSASKMSMALFLETFIFVVLILYFVTYLVYKWFCLIVKKGIKYIDEKNTIDKEVNDDK